MDCYRVNRLVENLSRLEDAVRVSIHPGDVVEAIYVTTPEGDLFAVRVMLGVSAGSTIGCGRAVLASNLFTPIPALVALAACADR